MKGLVRCTGALEPGWRRGVRWRGGVRTQEGGLGSVRSHRADVGADAAHRGSDRGGVDGGVQARHHAVMTATPR